MKPDPTAQHKRRVLIITTGLSGYRLAFVGGPVFEVIADGLTADQAIAAKQAAERLSGSVVA